MDRAVERLRWTPKLVATIATVGVSLTLALGLVLDARSTSLTIDSSRITVAKVEAGLFIEYIPILGKVEPIKTVFLDAVEGGQVQDIFVDDGRPISKGDLILRLSNAALQKDSISTESRLLENINTLRNTRIGLAEKELILKEQYLDNQFQISQLEKQHRRYTQMIVESRDSLAEVEFERIADELDYRRDKRGVIQARIEQERALREQQLTQVDATIAQVNDNLRIVGEMLENLNVRAPISGHLSTLKVELGQSIMQGENIGQIDQLHSFKISAQVDQHYISKVEVGQMGDFSFAQGRHELRIVKVYPEVSNDVFEVDMEFVNTIPAGLKRGQSLQINLSLSGAVDSRVLAKGGFYRSTGGRWVYAVTDDGAGAVRRDIRIGRQNPRYFELLDGLQVGDVVITSSYDGFDGAVELEFSSGIEVGRNALVRDAG